jgi:Sulfotransferase domain
MNSQALQNPQESSSRTAAEAPRSGIVWHASYPKSGNTWTRTFLHNLVHATSGETQAQQINELNRFSMTSSAKILFKEVLGFSPTEKDLDQIAAARARAQQYLADLVEGLIFVKTHQALAVDRGYSTINFSVTSGAIYIIRNPLDVAVSYAHHLGGTIDEAINLMNTKNAETAVSSSQVYELYGSWSQHVSSWTRKPHRAIFVMRYEDMLAEPQKTFDGLARHLLFTPTPEQLADAIDRSSFDRLREHFREGRAGQWKEVLTPAQIQRIVDAHGEQMQRFGYLPA